MKASSLHTQQSAYSESSGLSVTRMFLSFSVRNKRAHLFSQEVLCIFSAAHQQLCVRTVCQFWLRVMFDTLPEYALVQEEVPCALARSCKGKMGSGKISSCFSCSMQSPLSIKHLEFSCVRKSKMKVRVKRSFPAGSMPSLISLLFSALSAFCGNF